MILDQSSESEEDYEDNDRSESKLNDVSAGSSNEEDNNDEVTALVKSNLSWKDNLAQKARNAYLERQANTENLMKLVYGVFSMVQMQIVIIY